MTALLDTSALFALVNDEDTHHGWCGERIVEQRLRGNPIAIPDIVYCEFAYGMADQSAVDEALGAHAIDRVRTSDAALFRAAVAFKEYREKNKGQKLGVLPDF